MPNAARRFTICGLIAFLLFSFSGGQFGLSEDSITNVADRLPRDIDEVLWWLPEETEAVVVSKGNVPIMVQEPELPQGKQGLNPTPQNAYVFSTFVYDYQDLVAMNCTDPLGDGCCLWKGDEQFKLLKSAYGSKAVSVFLKAVVWESDQSRSTCNIVVFRAGVSDRIAERFASVAKSTDDYMGAHILKVDLNSGLTAEEFRSEAGRPYECNWRYLAAARPNVFVSTTNLALMKTIIERMQHRGATRALPSDLPEWRQFDETLPAWGLRHYRKGIASKDMTSMLKQDPGASGLVFFGGNKPAPFLALRYVSSSKDAEVRFMRLKADYISVKNVGIFGPLHRVNESCIENRVWSNVSEQATLREGERSRTAEATFNSIAILYLPYLGFPNPERSALSMQAPLGSGTERTERKR